MGKRDVNPNLIFPHITRYDNQKRAFPLHFRYNKGI